MLKIPSEKWFQFYDIIAHNWRFHLQIQLLKMKWCQTAMKRSKLLVSGFHLLLRIRIQTIENMHIVFETETVSKIIVRKRVFCGIQ